MKTVAEIRSYVREFYDLTSTDLSDNLLDSWMRAGYLRIIHSRPQHPWLQGTSTVNLVSGDQTESLTTYRRIVSVRAGSNSYPVHYVDHATASSSYATSTAATPRWWSWWNQTIYVWPIPSAAVTLTIDGYLTPSMAWVGQVGSVPTYLPDEYEPALLSWVLCEAAKWQQDSQSANNFAQDFAIELDEANNRYVSVVGEKMVVNGEVPRPRVSWSW